MKEVYSLRSLIDRIVLQPRQEAGRVDAELYGDLAHLVALEEKTTFSFHMKKISVAVGERFRTYFVSISLDPKVTDFININKELLDAEIQDSSQILQTA